MTSLKQSNDDHRYLTFQLGGEILGIPILTVKEINRVEQITPVPETPSYVVGVMNLRGEIIPVVNLRLKFNLEEIAFSRDTCIIVIELASRNIGIIVDTVKEVVDFNKGDVEENPLSLDGKRNSVVGMAKREDGVVILLDPDRAFEIEDQVQRIIEKTVA